jgi:DNA-binding NarL/FixJ family response regulator
MALLAQGMDNTRIAQQLAVATTTVKSHLQNMLRKAGAVNRAELIAQFYGQTRLTP